MATNLRVLVLEDDPADAELMIHALQQEGFVVEWKRVETDADYCARLEPTLDLILADYSLPQFDALQALRRLQEKGLDIPVIVATGSISEEAAVECMKRGAADYVLKDRLARLGPSVAQALEQRRLRQEKHKAAERLHLQSAALVAAANAIMLTDRDGRIGWVNPAFSRLTGYTLEEIWGQKASILKSGNHSAVFYRELWGTILSGQVWHGEVVNRRKDGSLYTEEMTITPVRDQEGTISHFVAIQQDITDRKRLEVDRLRLEAQLRQQQKLEAIGTLASGVAHEINNPLTGILNYAQLIADAAAPESRAAGHAREIMAETKRVATVVRNLLQFARQEQQAHSPARIQDIVEQTLSLLRAVFRRDQITLTVDVPENLPALHCRSQQLQQVLMNLLTNARDALNAKYPGYHPDKTIAITARVVRDIGDWQLPIADWRLRNERSDEVRGPSGEGKSPGTESSLANRQSEIANLKSPAGRWLRLTVADQGTGIPPEIQARIFDPFFTTKPRDKGTGLGLSISHGIVQDHHGRLRFETEPGVGTQFHLELPVDNGGRMEGE